ncbi:MAG TPA: hypothetical protein VFV50_16310 [Bdellovibrionales bacterium]|nr:hypothetical protein [Bdellovibrionales bacterium]
MRFTFAENMTRSGAWPLTGGAAVLAALLSWHTWYGPDIFYHLNLGRQILEHSRAQPPESFIMYQPNFVNIYWLFQVCVYGLFQAGGVAAINIAFGAAWSFIFCRAYAFIAAGTARTPLTLYALVLLSIVATSLRFEERPEVIGYIAIASNLILLFRRLESPGERLSLAGFAIAGLVQVAVTNSHAYFALGPILTCLVFGLYFAFHVLAARAGPASAGALARDGFCLLIVQLAASLLNPFGWEAWTYFVTLNDFLAVYYMDIAEFRPTFFYGGDVWIMTALKAYYVAIAAVTLRVLYLRTPLALTAGLIAAAGLLLMPLSYRNIPFLFLFSIPAVRVFAMNPYTSRFTPALAARAGRAAYLIAVAAVCASIVTSKFYHWSYRNQDFGTELKETVYSVSLANVLAGYGAGLEIFSHSSDGGFLQFSNPRIKPYNDSRFTDIELVAEYFNAINDPGRTWTLHRRHGFDGVLISFNYQEIAHFSITKDSAFTLSHADICHAFFSLKSSPVTEYLKQREWRVYAGEDLTRAANNQCLYRWAQSLRDYPDAALLAKIIGELDSAPSIPAFLFLAYYDLARQTGRREELRRMKTWIPRVNALEDGRLRQEVLAISLSSD